jgi:hypothetical protein
MTVVDGVGWDAAAFEVAACELLRGFPNLRLRVSGACMAPAIPEGAIVVLERAERARPRFGDVVLARHEGGLRLHRLVWAPAGDSAWRTQADRAPLFDAALRRADVLATVVEVDGSGAPPRRARLAAACLLRSLLRVVRLRVVGPEPS